MEQEPDFAPIGLSGRETLHYFNPISQAKIRFVDKLYQIQPKPTKKQSLQERNSQIRKQYLEGLTITELGQKYDLSVQRIFQIVNHQHH
jgi:hypothetical protein